MEIKKYLLKQNLDQKRKNLKNLIKKQKIKLKWEISVMV